MRKAAIAAAALLVSGCSGSQDGPIFSPPADFAQGFWVGATDSNRTLLGVVLDDGEYWLAYTPAGDPTLIAGFVQGQAFGSSGEFSSVNGRDFNFETGQIFPFTGAAVVQERAFIDGTLTYTTLNNTVANFTVEYDDTYELVPNPAELAGTYTGQAVTSAGGDNATITITGDGTLSGSSALGCNFTGSARPRSVGNVYDVTVTFGGGGCANGTATVRGVGFYDEGELLSAALNSQRTDGFLFIGDR